MIDRDLCAQNALHACSCWLQRVGAPDGTIVVVQIAPNAQLGMWPPGAAAVLVRDDIGDPEAELCDAAAPLADALLRALPDAVLEAAVLAVAERAVRLQLLLDADTESAELRLAGPDRAVALASVRLQAAAPH